MNGVTYSPISGQTPLGEGEIRIQDDKNIAADMMKSEKFQARLGEIGQDVIRDFDDDVASRTEYDKRRAQWRQLFAGFREPKDYPWPGCSNTHLGIIAMACLQFQARAYEALINREIVKCYVTGQQDQDQRDKADRATKFMNWQLRFQMKEWESDMDKSLLVLPLDGLVVKKTYYDQLLKRPKSMLIGPDEFVVSYRCKSLDEPETRKSHVLWLPLNKVRRHIDRKLFIEPEGLMLQPDLDSDDGAAPETKIMQDKIAGESEPDRKLTNKKKFIEQHVFLDLDYDANTQTLKETSSDTAKPFVVTVSYRERKVVRIVSRDVWNEQQQQYDCHEYFTDYSFIPNPDSVYAYGFGQLLDHVNESADTILNQLIDAGHLRNLIMGFVSKRSGMKKGDLDFEMGKFKEIDLMSKDIKESIYQFAFQEPSKVLYTLLGFLHTYAKELSTTAEWMNGKLPPSDTAATTMLAIIEQGLKVYSTIHKRTHRSFHNELDKIFMLDRQYLNEDTYFAVQDRKSRIFLSYKSGKSDFADNISLVPVSDPNITSRAERLIKAQQALQEVKTSPDLASKPEPLYLARREYFEALEVANIDEILPKPAPPPPPPDNPPEVENSMFLKEQSSPVLPQQNHKGHMASHEGFKQSAHYQKITPHGKKLHEAHEREHLSADYLQEEQQRKQIMAAQQAIRQGQGGMNGGQ